jgi:iron complex transport system substrate-binding protein
MLRKYIITSLLFILLSILLTTGQGCAAPPASKSISHIEIKDQLGRTVRLEKLPQRIISLAPSNTEIVFALGLEDNLVAVTDFCNYPPQAKQKPSIGGFSTPNIEKIVALTPDLVLATSIHEKTIIPQLEQRGMTVFALAPRNINDVIAAITLVGEITHKEEASRLVAHMKSGIKAITDKTDNLAEAQKPRVFYITWHDPLLTAGSGTLADELIRMAGGVNIAGNLSSYPSISLETAIAANPEVIITGVGMGTGADTPLKFAMNEPRLRNVNARLNNRIYGIDTDLVGRAGPRLTDALEQFAGFIHPELFPENKR